MPRPGGVTMPENGVSIDATNIAPTSTTENGPFLPLKCMMTRSFRANTAGIDVVVDSFTEKRRQVRAPYASIHRPSDSAHDGNPWVINRWLGNDHLGRSCCSLAVRRVL